jgi:hypothetical protein
MAGNVTAGISGFYITDIIINGTVAAFGSVATSEFRQANAETRLPLTNQRRFSLSISSSPHESQLASAPDCLDPMSPSP